MTNDPPSPKAMAGHANDQQPMANRLPFARLRTYKFVPFGGSPYIAGMRNLLILSLFPFIAAAETLVRTDFSDPAAYQPIPATHPAHIQGALPDSVLEDSSWAEIGVQYQHEKNPLGGDRGWLGVQLKGGPKGQAQLKWKLPPLDKQAQFRLSLTGSSPSNANITFAIRDGGPPWKAYWEKTIAPGGFINKQDMDFTLPALGEGKTLIAHLGQRGSFKLQEVRLNRRDPEELKREKAERLASAPDNLLPVTGFPLGLPPLWSTGNRLSWDLDIRVEAGKTPTSRGTIPLRLATRNPGVPAELYSAPFEPLVRNHPHTFSFYYKGILRDGGAGIRVNRDNIANTTLVSSPDEWKRATVTFTPDAMATFHVLHWKVDGDIEIDSVMLTAGDSVKPFRLQQDAEVVLSADRRKNHVIVDGVDAPEFQAAITGAPKGAKLNLLAVNMEGEAQSLPGIGLKGETVEILNVSIEDLFPRTPYGPFRIEARVVKDGQAISPASDLVLYRLRKPKYWGTSSTESPFGGHFHVVEPHLYSAKAIGQNWNRLHGDNGKWSYWSGVEPEKGKWTFHHDRMQAFRGAGFHIIGVWVHCPGWARIERQDNNGWPDNWWQPRDYKEYATYVERVTKEYKDTIQHWQIWNEPWGEFWFKEWRPELGSQHQWHPGPDPAGDYVRLSDLSYRTGKAALPSVTILGMHATIGDKGKRWMKKMVDRDAEKHTDVFSFHAYSGGQMAGILSDTPGQLADRLDRYILDPIRKKETIKEIPELWLTEGNVLGGRSHGGASLYRHSFILEPEPQSVLIAEAQMLAAYHLICFSKEVNFIMTYAQNAVEAYYKEKIGPFWGALGINGGELNPSAAVYAAMTWHLEGADFVERKQIKDVRAFAFQRGETAVAALIAGHGRDTAWNPPEGLDLTWRDYLGNDHSGPFDFGTIVWVEHTGSVAELMEVLSTNL